MTGVKTSIEAIAREHLNIDTLETRGRDSLDFYEVSVEAVRQALIAAYLTGIEECAETDDD